MLRDFGDGTPTSGHGPRLASAALCSAAVLALATSAQAEPTVLLITYQGMGKGVPTELMEQTTVVVANEIKATGINVVRSDDLGGSAQPKTKSKKNKDAPIGDPAAGDKAKELLASGKSAVEDQEFSSAIKKLKKAIRLLDDNGDAVSDLRLLSEAYLQLSIAYFQEGDQDEAEDALQKAIHFDPGRKLDDSEFPPIFIRIYDRQRHYVLKRPRARIEVHAKPGAQVLFDGRNLGRAPVVLEDVLPGTHWIRAESPGEAVKVKKVLVRSKRTIRVEFDGATTVAKNASEDGPVGVLGAISKNQVSRSHVSQLKAAGRRADADFVLFGGIHKTETAYNIYSAMVRVRDAEVGRMADIAFDLDLLSAQIEVYKLAADVKKESGKSFARSEEAPVFPLAKKLKLRRRRRSPSGAKETRLRTVKAAPAPVDRPKEPTVAEAPPPPEPDSGNGRRPAVAAASPDDGGVVKPKRKRVVPKDEEDDPVLNPPKSSGGGAVAGTTVIPVDEKKDDDDDGGLWWIWVVVGVAAVGAAGAGGYFVLSNQSPDEGTLRIRW